MTDQLSNNDEQIRLLFEQSKEHSLIILDPGARITYWSTGAAQTFGYAANEVLGQNVSMLFTPENLAAGMHLYEQELAQTGMEAEDDRWMLRKDGVRFWATGVLSPIVDQVGRLIGFGKLVRDRTDMRGRTEAIEKTSRCPAAWQQAEGPLHQYARPRVAKPAEQPELCDRAAGVGRRSARSARPHDKDHAA